ncbi:sugar ABC transporter substrate-binding protein [Sinorhizobium meliloti]|jgi:simple sugar transport system substrate-binding protein|uniref:sugar ABC transporter substrate-binding protein n=2 Tax=Rhizobium meliloti TaxID=382 RepID=UPI000FD2B2B3|nr:sugar ABC transporter substrate-binding protein [Sinorhizobium meliloti]MQV24835.1 substrate-binding domain-containing protein [Sinorhizobium meliloti]MQV37495.1 substrate-binding domain-containing protein [Sinorhizobium meliloti]RVE79207.1 sugar ABC transporter substrate-binding protein [Sinorhizobium meliloti]RVG42719.1 sugar ABC transporter substrate-binding protein [Sinorhizobium meliloti]RVM08314.1 sugar ABC transporter substrate-binding protein [Sinorhizobium meliloti]
MKKHLFAAVAICALGTSAHAERFVMITHTQGTDPFWPIVEKAGKEAASAVGAEFEYKFAPSGDMADMAKLVESATATQPDGIVVSLPDADALGGAIKAAVASGIPVITINSGLDSSEKVGAIMHVGQPESLAGEAAGRRAKAEGVKKALCLNQEAFNTALVDRCEGYFKSLGQDLNMIDVSNDVAQIKTRTAAALEADPDIDALLATGPHVCEAAAAAVEEVGAKVHLSCFDLSARVIDLVKAGNVKYTIDQQPYLQGYMPVVLLHLYRSYAGLLPGADLPSGPGFVDATNVDAVAAQAGTNR